MTDYTFQYVAQVWPYLLNHYKFGSSPEEREGVTQAVQTEYEKVMSEWLAIEAIIRQRDKETVAANLAKLSQGSTDGQIPLVRKDSSLSNEVSVFLSSSFSLFLICFYLCFIFIDKFHSCNYCYSSVIASTQWLSFY